MDDLKKIDMSRLVLSVPYAEVDRWHEAAENVGMELGEFISWAMGMIIKLRIVPFRSALRKREVRH